MKINKHKINNRQLEKSSTKLKKNLPQARTISSLTKLHLSQKYEYHGYSREIKIKNYKVITNAMG